MRNNQIPDFKNYRDEDEFVLNGVCYKRNALLGDGTTASVYRFDQRSDENAPSSLAVKVERPKKCKNVNRFEEGISFREDAYWNAKIYGLGVLSGDPQSNLFPHYLLMPYFAGVLVNKARLDTAREMVEWFIIIAHFVHEKMHLQHRAVHGDIKSNNIILDYRAKQAYLIDFGLTEHMGVSIGPYDLPVCEASERHALLNGVNCTESKKKQIYNLYPHTAPELFFAPTHASTSQDVYGLGFLLLTMFKKVNVLKSGEREKISVVILNTWRSSIADRWAIPAIISKLDADFISFVPRLMLGQAAVAHSQDLARQNEAAQSRAMVTRFLLPPLTKAVAARALGVKDVRAKLVAAQVVTAKTKLPPLPAMIDIVELEDAAEKLPSSNNNEKKNVVALPPINRVVIKAKGAFSRPFFADVPAPLHPATSRAPVAPPSSKFCEHRPKWKF